MENLIAESVNETICIMPCCEEPRTNVRLHKGARTCVRHLVLMLESDKAVLLDKLAASDACLRSAEQAKREMRAKLMDLTRSIERDAFIAALVHERDEAVRNEERVRRKLDEQTRALDVRIARNLI